MLRYIPSFLAGAATAILLAACGSVPAATPAAPAATPAAPPAAAQTTWLLTSDWHFNPFDDPKLVDKLVREPASRWRAILMTSSNPPSPYFKDTNFALLESALDEMRAVLPNPPVVLIAGDFLGHKFRDTFFELEPGAPESEFESFVDKDVAFLASEADRTYPHAQFLITVGNNDGYCGDYESTPRSPFLAHAAEAWKPLVNRNGTAPGFVREFSDAGYYRATLPAKPRLRAVVLNSVLWSALYENACGDRSSDPGAAELSWLATHITSQHPLLLTHIPPGVDEYGSWHASKPVPLYKVEYTRRLLEILAADRIDPTAFVIGHIHHATFEIARTGIGRLGAIVVPAISPNQGNNPAFVVATINPRGPFIADTTTYIYLLGAATPEWTRLYSFDEAYGLTAFDAPNLLRLQARMAKSESTRRQFFHYYNSASTMATPPPEKWPWYWCGHVHLTPPPYAACVAAHP